MRATAKNIWNIFTSIIVIFFVLIAVFLIGVRVIGGLRPFTVLSGSMEPELHVGDLIYVKECDPSDVKPGDTITFVLNEDLDVATHKVSSIDTEKKCFYTYGIANRDENGNYVMDGGTNFKNLIGKPVFSIPYLGYVSDAVMSPPGSYIAIIVLVTLLILAFIPDIVNIFFKNDEKLYTKEKPKAE